LLDFDREYVVLEIGTELTKARAELEQNVRIDGYALPMPPLSQDSDASVQQVEVGPAKGEDFGPPQTGALHEQNRRPLARKRSVSDTRELVERRPVDVRPPFWWPADLSGRIDLELPSDYSQASCD
jgi:hypothetical protein